MQRFGIVFLLALFLAGGTQLFAQNHVSVPLNHPVYYILDQAEARFLCSALPLVKPFTRGRILEAINEILQAEPGRFGGLNEYERKILYDTRAEFSKGKAGKDLWKGIYRFDIENKKGIHFAGDMGIAMESFNSFSYFVEDGESNFGTDTWFTLFLKGDVGENFSYGVDISGGLLLAKRSILGTYDTFASELEEDPAGEHINQRLDTFSHPLAFFPYTYQKRWDGFMFPLGSSITSSGFEFWPDELSMAPSMLAELSGTAFGDMLFLRAGRLQREWGGLTPGGSLVLNAAARPFFGIEALFNPVPWFSFSSITGLLEFYNGYGGIYDAAQTFQNAFSLYQLELNYKNYIAIGFGSGVIWPKRFELGYIFPLIDNFLYQNFIGKNDNASLHLNLRARYPGLGGIWFSIFADEMEVSSIKRAFELDRHMFAFQAGLQAVIPGIPFASLTLSYTKIEPYNYTHQSNFVPWYDRTEGPMEKAYVNNGVSLGHYLLPNSDEIKLRFDIHPLPKMRGHWQYQLIRHGADFGPHQVDGSSLLSELDTSGRGNKASLLKNFLNDGAYQWMHIMKIGAEYSFGSLPLSVFAETGFVYSYFTDISDDQYAKYNPTPAGQSARPPAEGIYRTLTSYLLSLGFKIFK